MNEWRAEVAQQRKAGRSWTEIARLLRDTFPELTETQIRDKAKDAFRVKTRQKVYGVFSDIHAPFTHPNFLKFLQDTFRRERVTDIICLGDLVDNHAISRFNSEPSAKGAYDELDRAIDIIERYTTAFPKVRMIKGNHDLIAYRQAATLGIGKRFIKDFRDIYGLPKGWKVNLTFKGSFVKFVNQYTGGVEAPAYVKKANEKEQAAYSDDIEKVPFDPDDMDVPPEDDEGEFEY